MNMRTYLQQRGRALTVATVLSFGLVGSGGLRVLPTAVHAAPAAVQSAQQTTYTVQRGDTLSAIARRYTISVQALISTNGLTSTTIYVGQTLVIPGGSEPGPVYPITYVVQRGDTLSTIARRYDTTVQALMQVNHLQSTTIYVGQRLTISVAADPNQPVIYHTVQRGDTLSGIARQYNVAVEAIRAANGLQSNTIYIGQILLIPNSLGYPTPTPEPNPDATARINFAPGTTSATVNGTVTDPAHRRYLVRAQAGQTMNVTLSSAQPTTSFSVVGVSGGQTLKGLGDGGNSWSGVLPQTQDYLIEIVTLEFSSTSYTLTVEIPAQSPPATNPAERIQFAPGGTSATVEGTVIYPTRNQYLVRAQGGQTMRVELVSDYGIANFSVQGVSDGQPLKRLENSDTVWSGTLPGTQDYLIQIATLEGSTTNYSLYVEVTPGTGAVTPQRIQFAPGATSATVTGHTSAIEPARYVLRANGGQQMNVTLNVDNANAYITVLHPNGNNLAGADGSVHNWTGWLPVSGDYIIEVLNPGTGLANFHLTVAIQ